MNSDDLYYRFWKMADKDSKAQSPTVQTKGCAIVPKSTLLQTPACPEQMKAFTLRSLIFGNIADIEMQSAHTPCVLFLVPCTAAGKNTESEI